MYKLSVPISISRFNEAPERHIKELKAAGAERVFLCGLGHGVYNKACAAYTQIDTLTENVAALRNAGMSVGFWVGGFGHGVTLEGAEQTAPDYTLITGSDGIVTDAFCPLDEQFKKDFADGLKQLAKADPDFIQIDDDYRLNARKYNLGCCCDLHMEQLRKRLGEDISREDVERKVLTGGKNRYRDAWLECQGDSMREFARYLRKELDTVAPHIVMSACACFSTWSSDGFTSIEISKILAGQNAPFLRTFGAPYHYHHLNVPRCVERTRMQTNWCRNEGIELFSEGDVYPRPRYNVPARALEMYDIALLATGEIDGILKYMYDYNRSVNYENGYVARHMKNAPLRQFVSEIFGGKKTIGVRVHEQINKLVNWDLPSEIDSNTRQYLKDTEFGGNAAEFMNNNAIPTVYDNSGDYPLAVFGENAKYITEDDLKNGAFIDVTAAKILRDRGIDTGIIDSELCAFTSEKYEGHHLESLGLGSVRLHKMTVSEKAQVKSYLLPHNTPGAYLYENAKGQRFYCIAYDLYNNTAVDNYVCDYYRQEQLIHALEWLCGKKLPIVCLKNPHLYSIVSKDPDGNAMAVLLINNFMDEIISPEIVLDKPYSEIRCTNCTATLEGNIVHLSEIEPFGIVAFEVK